MKREELTFFNPYAEITIHGDKLPHWQQLASTYFLTIRLGDSLPAPLLARWRDEREQWLRQHPEPWTEEIEDEYHQRFSRQLEEWLDAGHGSCPLASPGCRTFLSATFSHRDGDHYHFHAWVIMPNHAHLLFSLVSGHSLETEIAAWKSISARRINAHLGWSGPLWQENYFDRLIRNEHHFAKCVSYILNNPVKAHLQPDHYTHFETDLARQYSTGGGPPRPS